MQLERPERPDGLVRLDPSVPLEVRVWWVLLVLLDCEGILDLQVQPVQPASPEPLELAAQPVARVRPARKGQSVLPAQQVPQARRVCRAHRAQPGRLGPSVQRACRALQALLDWRARQEWRVLLARLVRAVRPAFRELPERRGQPERLEQPEFKETWEPPGRRETLASRDLQE